MNDFSLEKWNLAHCFPTVLNQSKSTGSIRIHILQLSLVSRHLCLSLSITVHVHQKYLHLCQVATRGFKVPNLKPTNDSLGRPTLWSLLISPSLYSLLPSIMPDRGFENHSLKSLWDWKTCGIRKCISDQSSIKLFWRGVPVKSSLQWLLKLRRYCHLWDLKFLMFWA